jgi:hypothetical protein
LTLSGQRPGGPVLFQLPAFVGNIAGAASRFMIVVDYLRYMTKTHHDHGMPLRRRRGAGVMEFLVARVAQETDNLNRPRA